MKISQNITEEMLILAV